MRVRRVSFLRLPHPYDVVHAVDVAVSHVDTDGPQGEAVGLARAVDGEGGSGHADCRAVVTAGGRVT